MKLIRYRKKSIKTILGVTKAKRSIAKATGIPTTKAGRKRKTINALTNGSYGKFQRLRAKTTRPYRAMKRPASCMGYLLQMTTLAMVISVLVCALITSACAVEKTQIIPLNTDETHALLLKYGENNFVIGGAHAQKVTNELAALNVTNVAEILSPCTHPEHVGAVEELRTLLKQEKTLADEQTENASSWNMTWFEQGFSAGDEDSYYAFGVEQADERGISFRCDGSLIPFTATTNETSVNVRSQASTAAQHVAKLQRGSTVSASAIVKNADHEVWYEVSLSDGQKGYIRQDLICFVNADDVKTSVSQVNTTAKEERYIGNKKSKVFHRSNCKTLPSGKNQVYFDSKDYAVSKGYKPCQNCKP